MDKSKLWDEYSKKYNLLSDKLIASGIDSKLLKEIIILRERIGFQV